MLYETSRQNEKFWSEPCGSQLASALGISETSGEDSLSLFDENYFTLYPYLKPFLEDIVDSATDVLEVGLGMGTVSEWLADLVPNYHGLDIANGPVQLVNQRLQRKGIKQNAIQGSILASPYPSESFDAIVAIGCLHHTSDLRLALNECRRILRPNGKLKIMVYYAYSARRIFRSPLQTFSYLFREIKGSRCALSCSTPEQRALYDTNSLGEAAPYTDVISRKSLKSLCVDFKDITCELKNFESEDIWRFKDREYWLRTYLPSIFGLDLYATLVK
jgi:SAM-dependent methyltransferase